MSAELRAGYKQTEVGVLPEEWKVTPLRRLAEIRGGIAKNENVVVSDPVSVHYLRVANVQDGYLNLSEMSKIQLSRQDLARYLVLPGDVLMNEGGDLDQLGRGAIWHGEFNPCVHQNHVFVVRCKDSLVPDYLNVWTATSAARRFFLLAGKQTTNLASISKSSLGELPVAVPITTEQRVIAAALSDVDGLLGGLDRLIAKKQGLKVAAMQQLLTGQTRLPGFNGEWTVLSIARNATLKARIGWQSLTTEEYLTTGIYYLVTGTDFIDGRVDWNTCHFVDKWRYDQDRNIQLKDGDVLVTKDGTIGKVGFVEGLTGPATLNSGLFVIRPIKDSFFPAFLFYILRSRVFDDFISKITAGSTITHLYQKDFVEFKFLAPELGEQVAIATVLSEMDAELTALQERLTKIKALKQAMMQELLTGRIRLV